MAEEFENIPGECISRLLQGENPEQCLQRYPEQAKQLELLVVLFFCALLVDYLLLK